MALASSWVSRPSTFFLSLWSRLGSLFFGQKYVLLALHPLGAPLWQVSPLASADKVTSVDQPTALGQSLPLALCLPPCEGSSLGAGGFQPGNCSHEADSVMLALNKSPSNYDRKAEYEKAVREVLTKQY